MRRVELDLGGRPGVNHAILRPACVLSAHAQNWWICVGRAIEAESAPRRAKSAICRPASAQGITKNSPYAAHKLGGLAEASCTVTRAILIPVPGTRSTPLSSYLPEVRQRSAGRHHECHVKCHSSGTFRLTWYPVRCSKIHHDLAPPYGIEP